MIRHAFRAVLVAGWLLLATRDPDERAPQWREVGTFRTESHCEYGRTGEVERVVLGRIGSALASQPADNPIRRQAYARALTGAQRQFRCVHE